MGYRGMCRFFSGSIFTHPALSKFEWYMRLDTGKEHTLLLRSVCVYKRLV